MRRPLGDAGRDPAVGGGLVDRDRVAGLGRADGRPAGRRDQRPAEVGLAHRDQHRRRDQRPRLHHRIGHVSLLSARRGTDGGSASAGGSAAASPPPVSAMPATTQRAAVSASTSTVSPAAAAFPRSASLIATFSVTLVVLALIAWPASG